MKRDNPQYQLDIEGLAGIPDPDVSSYDDVGGFLGTHDTNLFDQNEGRLGSQLIDEATGEPIDNSTYTGLEGLTIHEAYDEYYDAPPILDPETIGSAWLIAREMNGEVIFVGDRLGKSPDVETDTSAIDSKVA